MLLEPSALSMFEFHTINNINMAALLTLCLGSTMMLGIISSSQTRYLLFDEIREICYDNFVVHRK
jgi:hypothetical protein